MERPLLLQRGVVTVMGLPASTSRLWWAGKPKPIMSPFGYTGAFYEAPHFRTEGANGPCFTVRLGVYYTRIHRLLSIIIFDIIF
jgi:hypothetical protein